MKFANSFSEKVDMKKVNVEIMSRWITEKITEILGFEDEVVIGMCINMLNGTEELDPRALQLNLTGFLEKSAMHFVAELWALLLDAQTSPTGIPSVFLERKKQEIIKHREVEQGRVHHQQQMFDLSEQIKQVRAEVNAKKAEQELEKAAKEEERADVSETILQRIVVKEMLQDKIEEDELLQARLKALEEETDEEEAEKAKEEEQPLSHRQSLQSNSTVITPSSPISGESEDFSHKTVDSKKDRERDPERSRRKKERKRSRSRQKKSKRRRRRGTRSRSRSKGKKKRRKGRKRSSSHERKPKKQADEGDFEDDASDENDIADTAEKTLSTGGLSDSDNETDGELDREEELRKAVVESLKDKVNTDSEETRLRQAVLATIGKT